MLSIETYGQLNKKYEISYTDKVYNKVFETFETTTNPSTQKEVLGKVIECRDSIKASIESVEIRKLILSDTILYDSLVYYIVSKNFEENLLNHIIQGVVQTRVNWEFFITRDKSSFERVKEKLFGEKKFNAKVKTSGDTHLTKIFIDEWAKAQKSYENKRKNKDINIVEENKSEAFMVMALNIRDAMIKEKTSELKSIIDEEFKKMFRK